MCECIKNLNVYLSKERMTKSDLIGKLTKNIDDSETISNYQKNMNVIRLGIIENFKAFLKHGRVVLTTKDIAKETFLFNSAQNGMMVLTAVEICNGHIYLNGFNEEKLNTQKTKVDIEGLIWDSLSVSQFANEDNIDFILRLVHYLDDCGLIKELRSFNVLITIDCNIKARTLQEALEMAYRTSASDINGNDITHRVVECKKKL